MKKSTGFLLIALGLVVCACHGAMSLRSSPSSKGASMHAGTAYEDSCSAALLACQWPDEYPGSDEPGAAYEESRAAAEDSDCIND